MRNQIKVTEGYYSEQEVADMLGLTVPTLRSYHSKTKGLSDKWTPESSFQRPPPKRTKIGRNSVYKKDTVREWIEQGEEGAANSEKISGHASR